jgi:hypothetical protein
VIKKIYYRILRDIVAMKILSSLVSSSERYNYISLMVESKQLTNDEATQKNINKALKMANQFIKSL